MKSAELAASSLIFMVEKMELHDGFLMDMVDGKDMDKMREGCRTTGVWSVSEPKLDVKLKRNVIVKKSYRN